MQLIWHIFRKDARRLWWATAPALAMLAWFGHLDRWRGDQMTGSAEDLLTVLLPVLWVLMTGLLVLEDRVIGDREFWLTLPCGWRSMLAAKALFLTAFISLPCFLVQTAILWARGFPPYLYLPQLLWKQALIALLLLPAMALALLVRDMAGYLLFAVLMVASVSFLQSSGARFIGVRFLRVEWLRVWLALIPVLVTAAAVIVFQYASRRAGLARTAGAAAVLVANAIFLLLPSTTSAEWICALNPAKGEAPVSIKLSPVPVTWSPEDVKGWAMSRLRGGVSIRLPLEVTGELQGPLFAPTSLGMDMRMPDGATVRAPYPAFRGASFFYGGLSFFRQPAAYLNMSSLLYERAVRGPVDLSGAVEVDYRRLGLTTRLGLMTSADVPGVGKCVSTLTEGRALRPVTLKVDCESPLPIPYPTRVAVFHPESGRRWVNTFGGSGTSWLSPLNHATTHFQLATEEIYADQPAGGHWVVPEEALAGSRLEIMPELPAGSTFVKYELRGVDLKRYAPPEK